MAIVNQDMELAMGLPVIITGFDDNEPRYCYPFTLATLRQLNGYLSVIDDKILVNNLDNKGTAEVLYALLSASFRVQDEDFVKLINAITENNYADIISDIKKVSGISDVNGEKDLDNSKNVIDWQTAVSSLTVYGHVQPSEVPNLTLTRFNDLMTMIGKKINWEYKSSTIALTEKPGEYIDEKDHPLYSEPKPSVGGATVGGRRMVTMKEIMGFTQG